MLYQVRRLHHSTDEVARGRIALYVRKQRRSDDRKIRGTALRKRFEHALEERDLN